MSSAGSPNLSHSLAGAALAAHAARLPLDEAFRALAEDAHGGTLRDAALELADRIAGGADLATSLSGLGAGAPRWMQRLLEAAPDDEQALAVIDGLFQHEQQRQHVRRRVAAVMVYPATVFGLGLAVFAGVSFFVVPQFEAIFADFEIYPSQATRIALGLSAAMPPALVGVAALGIGYAVLTLLPATRRLAHWLRTAVPFVGRIWILSAHHELASVLSALTARRVALDEALACAEASLADRNLARAVRLAATKCAGGAPLARSLEESIHIDPTLAALVGWGEARDALPEALAEARAAYEEALEVRVELLRCILPPALLMIVATAVLLCGVGLLLPLIRLLNGLW